MSIDHIAYSILVYALSGVYVNLLSINYSIH